jgi:hypothetical protein
MKYVAPAKTGADGVAELVRGFHRCDSLPYLGRMSPASMFHVKKHPFSPFIREKWPCF